MTSWDDIITTCKICGNDYPKHLDHCPKASCQQQTISLEDLISDIANSLTNKATSVSSIPLGADTQERAETVNFGGMATSHDFSNDIPVKIGKAPKRGGSQKWSYKGHKLDSTNEKERFLYLEALEERGIISRLDTQFEICLLPPVVVSSSHFFAEFVQPQEIYTVDFVYKYLGYNIYEDAKDKRFTPKKKLLKPRVKPASATKAKALQEILAKRSYDVFIYSVFYKSTWHYFNTKLDESKFRLE